MLIRSTLSIVVFFLVLTSNCIATEIEPYENDFISKEMLRMNLDIRKVSSS